MVLTVKSQVIRVRSGHKLSENQFLFVQSYVCITKREEMTTYFRIPSSSMHSVNLVCLTFKRFGISNMIQMC